MRLKTKTGGSRRVGQKSWWWKGNRPPEVKKRRSDTETQRKGIFFFGNNLVLKCCSKGRRSVGSYETDTSHTRHQSLSVECGKIDGERCICIVYRGKGKSDGDVWFVVRSPKLFSVLSSWK